MKTLIGKTYITSDNSYCKNLTGVRDYRLAGTTKPWANPVSAVIVSEPYNETIINVSGAIQTFKFINVWYLGDVIRVLYQRSNVDANLQERIETLEEIRDMYFDIEF